MAKSANNNLDSELTRSNLVPGRANIRYGASGIHHLPTRGATMDLPAYRATVKTASVVIMMLALGSCDRSTLMSDFSPRPDIGDVAVVARAPFPFQNGHFHQSIGKEGGSIHFGIGHVTFPPGALEKNTQITAIVDGYSVAVTLEPSGLQFSPAARPRIRFNFAPENRFGEILYVDARNVVLERLVTRTHGSSLAEAELTHFSKYIFGVE